MVRRRFARWTVLVIRFWIADCLRKTYPRIRPRRTHRSRCRPMGCCSSDRLHNYGLPTNSTAHSPPPARLHRLQTGTTKFSGNGCARSAMAGVCTIRYLKIVSTRKWTTGFRRPRGHHRFSFRPLAFFSLSVCGVARKRRHGWSLQSRDDLSHQANRHAFFQEAGRQSPKS